MENDATDCYFHLLRKVGTHQGDAGDVCLRILRDLKRIHSHIAALACPILDRADLLQNRLVEVPINAAPHEQKAGSRTEISTSKSSVRTR
jgi:phosphate:Na+ symporter